MLKFLWLLPIVTIAIPKITQAQRPSFAGMRPPGGLTQKDKYAQTKNTAVENFNGSSGPKGTSQKKIINLPYGAPQRPPMGVPLVHPSTPEELSASYSPVNKAAGFPTQTAPDNSRLPIDARGDRDWVNRLKQLPVDQQPFWLVNYQAIEAMRNSPRPSVGNYEWRGSSFGG
ncbi:uncharacterized protein LOC6739019 [Drosophila simulans]|uniref:GD14972 n=1 Tax=Drosophila simulans TaxID=7240 RepID=B4QK62_DROSI|nr:uncharacterized protein LOC6739019 [Drosophila simulans]EDX11399.1 GD14972 [Drosophila simulans]KMZ01040.1 uncharacterized protein Dsimw501_GD14972 [Drosophila simulans]